MSFAMSFAFPVSFRSALSLSHRARHAASLWPYSSLTHRALNSGVAVQRIRSSLPHKDLHMSQRTIRGNSLQSGGCEMDAKLSPFFLSQISLVGRRPLLLGALMFPVLSSFKVFPHR